MTQGMSSLPLYSREICLLALPSFFIALKNFLSKLSSWGIQ